MRKSRAIILTALVAFSSVLAYATGQRSDNLLLDGKSYFIFTNPLEPYLEQNPEKRPRSEVVSSDLWRGYVATWEVKDGHLLLTDVAILKSISKPGQSGFDTELSSVMSNMFPGQKAIPATWFSGHLIVPDGKLVRYVHMGYASTYSHYILLRVEKGEVTREWSTDAKGFTEFRNSQFEAFKKTEEYRKALAEAKKESNMTPEQNEEFLREYYSGRYTAIIFDNPR